jgi:hypothetical protein
VGWWPFNGNANDASGNGNDGVVNGAVLAEDRFGNTNQCYNFNANNGEFIQVPSSPSLNSIQTGISILCWIFMDGGTGSGAPPRVLELRGAYGGGGDSGYIIRTIDNSNESRSFEMRWYNNNGNSSLGFGNTTSTLNALQWHHIMFVADGLTGTAKYYYDGELIDSSNGAVINSCNYNNNSLFIGAEPNLAGRWGGLLDDIAIYNRALTEQEIQNVYNGSSTTTDSGDGAAPLPQGIPYQAAARDANGQPVVDSPVNVRFSLREGAADGAASYIESHGLTTNSIGLFNTVFGNGTPEQSTFDSINWAATTKFLQVEVDLGNGYLDMGTTQLLSVPYAFRSAQAANIKNAALPVYSDNTAALSGGLVAGEMYRTATGDLKIVY